MKRILYITAFRPSRISAGENYSLSLLNALSENINIDLIYFLKKGEKELVPTSENLKVLMIIKLNFFSRISSYITDIFVFPVFNSRFNISRKGDIVKLANSGCYDLVILDYGQTFSIGLDILKVRKVLIAHDVLFQRYSRINFLLGMWCMRSEKVLMRQQNAEIFTFSIKDQSLIKDLYGVKSRLTDFFVGKDVLYFEEEWSEKYFVFYGRWSRNDNLRGLLWFFDVVFPRVKNFNFKFKVIGADMPIDCHNKLSIIGVDVLGYVQNPYEIIGKSAGLIAPVFSGAGVKVKVLDSLACGVRVIGTDIAFEGIKADLLSFCLECKSIEDYVKYLIQLHGSDYSKRECFERFHSLNNPNLILDFINENLA